MTGREKRSTIPALFLALWMLPLPTPLWAGGGGESPVESAVYPSRETTASGKLPERPPVPTGELPSAFVGQEAPGSAGVSFTTDFSRATISFADILSGGPPKGGIPAIDHPSFVSVNDAAMWLDGREPVLVMEASIARRAERRAGGRPAIGDAGTPKDTGGNTTRYADQEVVHIYPLQILTWHEIVNDEVGGVPVSVTYCPLCNTGIAFLRRHHGAVLRFNTTGRLRFSNLIMFDRETETWWQQASGDGIAGFFAGTRLSMVPILMLPFAEARESWPEARVLSRDTGFNRAYGSNPYAGYDSTDRPFLLRGAEGLSPSPPRATDGNGSSAGDRSPATSPPGLLDRVVSLEHNGETASVAYRRLQRQRLVALTVGGTRFYVLWEAGTASALDTPTIAEGNDVGSANAFFARTRDGRPVHLTVNDGIIVDETGSTWNAGGRATAGPAEGMRLDPAPGVQHFWFSHATLVAQEGNRSY